MSQLTMEEILEYLDRAQQEMTIYRSNGSTELFDSDLVYYELWRYWTYYYVKPERLQTINAFMTDWTSFVGLYAGDLERAYDALYADYDPISNYDMIETASDGTMQDTTTDTVTPSGRTKTTAETLGKMQTESKSYVGGYDSTTDTGAFSDRTLTVNEPGTGGYKVETVSEYLDDANTETEHGADNSLVSLDLPGSGYNRLSDHKLSRRGNIGVTTAQQMIESELALRKTELLADFVHRFIRRHFAIGRCTS